MINSLLNIGLIHYLLLALILFLIGLIGVVISRNLLRIVMSILIMSIAVVINFIAFGYYCDNSFDNANIMSILVLLISVIQAIVAIVILYKIYRNNEYLDTEKIKDKED